MFGSTSRTPVGKPSAGKMAIQPFASVNRWTRIFVPSGDHIAKPG